MKYALVAVMKPENLVGEPRDAWHRFLEEVPYTGLNTKGIDNVTCKISESSWLLSLDANTQFLAQIVVSATTHNLENKVFYFSESPTAFLGTLR